MNLRERHDKFLLDNIGGKFKELKVYDSIPSDVRLKEAMLNHFPSRKFDPVDLAKLLENRSNESIFDILSRKALHYINLSNYKIETPFLLREFPTGDFNALSIKFDEGYLVYLNTGLIALYNRLSKIYGYIQMTLAEAWKVDSSIDFDEFRPLTFSVNEFINMIAETVISYVTYKPLRHNPMRDIEKSSTYESCYTINSHVLLNMELFTVIHELCHIIIEENNYSIINKKTPAGNISVLDKSHEVEFKSDLMATKILLVNQEEFSEMELSLSLSGFLTPFYIQDLIETVYEVIFNKNFDEITKTHPRALVRMVKVIREFVKIVYRETDDEFLVNFYEAAVKPTDLSHKLIKQKVARLISIICNADEDGSLFATGKP